MKFYQEIKLQLNNLNDHIVASLNNIKDIFDYIDHNLKSDNEKKYIYQDIVSKVINYREKSLRNGKSGNECALFTAANSRSTNIVEYLLSTFGTIINIDNPNNVGRTPLYVASYFGHVKIVHLLLNYNYTTKTISNIDVNKQDIVGFTPLFVAAKKNKWKCVELLLKSKQCDINLSNNKGETPLWIAAGEGCIESLKLLLKYGASVDKRDEKQVCMMIHCVNICK